MTGPQQAGEVQAVLTARKRASMMIGEPRDGESVEEHAARAAIFALDSYRHMQEHEPDREGLRVCACDPRPAHYGTPERVVTGPSESWPDEPLTPETFPMMLEALSPSSLVAHLARDRPYNGQPHTDMGERGRTRVRGLTMRDVRDCFIRACYDASGLPIKQWPGSVNDLPWSEMDIVAVAQNLSCNIERYMGIYPNVPPLLPADPTEPHWCGQPLDTAKWTSHEGDCPQRGLAERWASQDEDRRRLVERIADGEQS